MRTRTIAFSAGLSALLLAFAALVACADHAGEYGRLANASAQLSAPLVVSAEVELEPPSYLPSTDFEWLKDLVYNGQDWVVLRDGGAARLSRITREGQVIDSLGVRLHDGPVALEEGALASDGTNVASVWYGTIEQTQHLWLRIYDRELRGLGEPLTLTTLANPAIRDIAIGWGGGVYLVAWSQWPFPLGRADNAYFMRISSEGVPIDAEPIKIPGLFGGDPRVSWDGEAFAVIWGYELTAVRITPGGELLDGAPVPLGHSAGAFDVCFANGMHTVVWSNPFTGSATPVDTFALRLNRDLVPVESQPIVIADGARTQGWPRCTANQAATLIVWRDENPSRAKLSARGITPGGDLGGIMAIANEGTTGSSSALLANDGEQALALWHRGGSRIRPEGAIDGGSIVVRHRVVEQTEALVSVGPAEALLTFRDQRPSDRGSLRVQRVSFDGRPRDTSSQAIYEPQNPLRATWSSSDGRGHLVVFSEWSSVERKELLYALPVTLEGNGASEPALIAESAVDGALGDVRIASAHEGYLVTFGEGKVYGRRISSAGAPLDAPVALTSSESRQTHARVAFTGEHYVVMWQDDRQPPAAIWTTRVSTAGELLDPIGLRLTRGTVDADREFQMVSVDDGTYAIWSSWGSRGAELHGSYFGPDGFTEHDEGVPLTLDLGDLALASDGKRVTLLGTRGGQVFAARLSKHGRVLQPPVLVTDTGSYAGGGVALLPNGAALVTYARADEPELASRVRVRTVAPALDEVPDAGSPVDGGAVSAGPDASEMPTEPNDGGMPLVDGATEAGASDASARDAGSASMDAEASLGGDAGHHPHDAGSVPDADAGMEAVPDADVGPGSGGPVHDAAADDEPPDDAPEQGCSCAVTASAPTFERPLCALFLALYLVGRRRVERRSASRERTRSEVTGNGAIRLG